MPSKIRRAIGAVKDHTSIGIAKVTTATNNINAAAEVTILKATTHDDDPIDEKHVTEILQMMSTDKSFASVCARTIGKRIGKTKNWIVALKSLTLVLRIFQDGDPQFPKQVSLLMKHGTKILNLTNFRDDSNSNPWDYTLFVRAYALYLDDRLDCFLNGKLQKTQSIRSMKPEMLLNMICYWQRLLDRAMATMPTGRPAKTNRLIQICLYTVVKESFDLYKDISDALALLLDSFFHHLQYQSCLSAFQLCVRASKQFEDLSCFYDECKSIGVGKTSEYPSVQKISDDLVETLEEFLKDEANFGQRRDDDLRFASLEDLMNLTDVSTMGSPQSPSSNFSVEEEQEQFTAMTSPLSLSNFSEERFTDCTTSPSNFSIECTMTKERQNNPFLDTINDKNNPSFITATPPTFSISSQERCEEEDDDPFAPWPAVRENEHDQHGALFEQQLWLRNQNSIIAKQWVEGNYFDQSKQPI